MTTLENKMTVLFDFDGVIVNTIPLHYQAWKEALEEYITLLFDDYLEKIDGKSRIVGIQTVLPDATESQIAYLSRKKQALFIRLVEGNGVPVFESSLTLLRNLRNRGISCGLVSSSRNCRYLLSRLNIESSFDVIISGSETPVGRGKPQPDVFLMGMNKMNGQPESTIVIEDSYAGILAARNAGMKCVAINRRGISFHALPDIVVNDLSELSFDRLKNITKNNNFVEYKESVHE